MFHNHPALVQTLLDDRYRRMHAPHGVPGRLTEVTRASAVRTLRRAQRQAAG